MLLWQIAVRHQYRPAALFENSFQFDFIQFAAQFGFLLVNLRVDVLRKFRDDVFLLFFGQSEFNGLQIPFEKLHDHTPSRLNLSRNPYFATR
jgi:hypothetical protein